MAIDLTVDALNAIADKALSWSEELPAEDYLLASSLSILGMSARQAAIALEQQDSKKTAFLDQVKDAVKLMLPSITDPNMSAVLVGIVAGLERALDTSQETKEPTAAPEWVDEMLGNNKVKLYEVRCSCGWHASFASCDDAAAERDKHNIDGHRSMVSEVDA